MLKFKLAATAASLAIGLALGATAAGAADVPATIKERGKVIVAIDVSHPPYGMLDSEAKETGSDVETAKLLAEDMGVPLEIVPVSGANRVPSLISRKVDMVIASFSITVERKKVIDYSKPYGVIPVVISASKETAIKAPADLAGESLAVARGTTADIELTRLVKDNGVDANIVRYEDEATTNTAVATGQQNILAAALSTANEVAEQNPALNLELKIDMAAYPMAVGLRKGDDELKAWVDEWVAKNLENGKLNTIYEKYFHQSLPKTIPEE
ncbi:polar amino acid transport system substrate-binding protein [Rhizobium azooxidifex]|uniref:Polar amino acid transport system substrate-binding protein n=1 Tax=Mycoplana azooxidifex TaxID=1636188 RepID=A0A7W6GLN7_9HYPH|nr:transporter substrate-binding domain-containing protein [Mycoplana azooxidifex]MBB3979592.1 polar amino acid transport system substrate-binding protein [Mycoplana azooxidifex]